MLTNMNSIKLQLDRFNCFHAYCHHYIAYYQKSCCILDQNVVSKRMKFILLFILAFDLNLISFKFIPILVTK